MLAVMRGMAVGLVVVLVGCGAGRIGGNDELAEGGASGSESSASGGESSASGSESAGDGECTPILQAEGQPSGFETCPHDATLRVEARACADPLPPSSDCGAGYGDCASAADCNAAPYGACQGFYDISGGCWCTYGCVTDDECGAGKACMCAPIDQGTICIEAECRSNADCPPGLACMLSLGEAPFVQPSLHCQTPDDECRGHADCVDSLCRWDDDAWRC